MPNPADDKLKSFQGLTSFKVSKLNDRQTLKLEISKEIKQKYIINKSEKRPSNL